MSKKNRAGFATTRHQNNYSTKWLKNAMKSVGLSTQEVMKDISPNIYEVTSTGINTSRNIVNSLRKNRGGIDRVQGSLQNNKYVKFAQSAYKNAMTDLKSGNFNNQDRMMDSMFGDAMDDVKESMDGFSFGDDGAESGVNVNYINAAPNNDALINVGNQIQAQSKANLKTQKASMDAFIAVNAASMQQSGEIGSEIVNQLANVNSNLSAIVQYQNENMTKFIEASMAYYDRSGASLDKGGEGSPNQKISAADVLNGRNGGLNIGQYKQYVKQQFKDMSKNSDVGFVASMIDDDMLSMAASNPLGFLSKGLVSYMMPKILKSSVESMEQTFSNFMPAVLSKLADWGDEQGSDFLSGIKRSLGKSLGLKNERTKNLKDAKVNYDATPFDGETKHAITEVITKELRDQTGYLRIIANHYDSNADKNVKDNGEYWDKKTNSYIKGNTIDKSIAQEFVDAITGTFNDTSFGKSMSSLVDAQTNEKSKKEMEFTINELFTEIEKQDKFMSINDLISVINSTGAGKNTKKLIKKYVRDMADRKDESLYNLNTARLQSQKAANDAKQRIASDSDSYHLWNSSFNGVDDIDPIISQVMGFGKTGKDGKHVGRYQKHMTYAAPSNSNDFGSINQFASSAKNHMTGILSALMKGGDIDGAMKEGSDIISEQIHIIGSSIKKTLFGDNPNENGKREGGIFSGLSNGFTDLVNMMKWNITGKEYTDTAGNRHEATEDSVLANFKKIGGDVKDGIMYKIFGKTKDENGKYVRDGEAKGIFSGIANTFKQGFDGWTDSFFGTGDADDPEKARKDAQKNIVDGIKKGLPNALSGSAIGAGVGMLSGTSILGALIGGPLGGAALGATAGFLSKNEKFQKWLFGEKDEDGNRLGGIISKKTQDYFKKNKDVITGGGAIGAITGTITGGGLLGTIVGGPIAGALMGVAGGMISKSKMFNRFLYGDEKTGQKGIFKAVSDAFNKHHKQSETEATSEGWKAGMSLSGAAGGAIGAAMLGKMGIIGASLTPLGPIGGAIFGLAMGIKAQNGSIKEWLFGKEGGLTVGGKQVKKQGVFGQIGNAINANILRPMKTNFKFLFKDAGITLEHKILAPFAFAAEGIAGKVGDISTKISEGFTNVANGIGSTIKDGFMDVMRPGMDAFSKAMNGVTTFAYKAVKSVVTTPFKLMKLALSKPMQFLKKKVLDPVANLVHDASKLVLTGIGRIFGYAMKGVGNVLKVATSPVRFLGGLASTGINKAKGALKNKLGDRYDEVFNDGDDSFIGRWRRNVKEGQYKSQELKKERNEWKRHDKNAKYIAKYTKNQYSEDTDEARQYLKMINPRAYEKLISGRSEGFGFKNTLDENGQSTNTSLTHEQNEARIAREGRSIAGLSSEQLSNQDVDDLNEEGRQTYFLQGIFNILRGKNWNGKDPSDGDESLWDNLTGHERNAIQNEASEENARVNEHKSSENQNDDDGSLGPGNDMGNNTSSFKEYLNRTKNDLKAYFTGEYIDDGEGNTVHNKGILGRTKDYWTNEGSKWKNTFGSLKTVQNHRINSERRQEESRLEARRRQEETQFENQRQSRRETDRQYLNHHANGGDTSEGMSVVGERGPEVIHTNNGDHVYKNGTAVPVNLVGASNGVFSKLLGGVNQFGSKITGKFLNSENDRKEGANNQEGVLSSKEREKKNKESQDKAIDRAKTADELKEENKKKKEASTPGSIVSKLNENIKVAKDHGSNWLKIFGKKGIITAGLVAAAALIIKHFPTIAEGIGNISSKILNFIGDSGKNIADQAKFAYEHDALTNGENVGQRIGQNIENISNGDILYDENGNLTNQTTARVGGLARLAKNVISSDHHMPIESKATKFQKKLGKGIKGVGSFVKDKASNLVGKATTSSADNAIRTAVESGDGLAIMQTAQTSTAKESASLADNVASSGKKVFSRVKNKVSKGAGKVGEKLVEKASKNDGLLSKVCKSITEFSDTIVKKFGKKAGGKMASKGASSLFSKLKPSVIIDCVKTYWDNIVAKVTSFLGIKGAEAAVSFGLSEVVFATIGAINGVSGTAKLFHVDNDKVDGKMRTIAGLFGGIAGTTVGGIIDIVCQLIYDIMGVDLLNTWATGMYNAWANDEDSETLSTAQKDFEVKYDEYQNDTLKKQYDAQIKAGIIDKSVTLEDFTVGAHDGTYKADYKSFSDYNTDQHKSIGDHIMSGFSKAGKGIKGASHTIFGYSTKQYTDSNGNVYVKNDDGLWDVTDAEGNSLGSISEDAIPEDAVEEKKHQKSKVTKAIGKGLSKAGKGIKGIGKSIGKGVSNGWGKLTKTFSKTKDTVIKSTKKDLSNKITVLKAGASVASKIWKNFKENGLFGKKTKKDKEENNTIYRLVSNPLTYYKIDKDGKTYSLYNDDGDVVTKADKTSDEIKEMLSSSLLTKDTLSKSDNQNTTTKKSKNTLIDKLKTGASSLWKSATSGISGIFSKIKTWATGGSGNGENGSGSFLSKIANSLMKKDEKASGGSGGGFGSDTLNGSTYYSQNDPRWGNKSYSMGSDDATMSEAGCGPSAMAMAASDAIGKNVNPVQMASLAKATGNRDETGTNWNFINQASGALGLSSQQALNPSASYIDSQLSNGNPVILSGTSGGTGDNPYTPAGHYVVAVGKDKNGKVIVNDPRGKGYSGKYDLSKVAKKTGSAWSIGGHGKGKHGGRGVDTAKWIEIVKAVKQAIAAQKPGYNQKGSVDITIGGKTLTVRTDCSGFVSACLKYYGVMDDASSLTSSEIANTSNNIMQSSGFTASNWSGWDTLQEGDIIALNGHTEIFARNENGQHYVYNCGSNSSVNNPNATTSGHSSYTTVWSPGGAGAASIAGASVDTATSSADSGSTSIWDKLKTGVSNFFSEFSSRAMSGLATGDWSNTDYSGIWGDSTGDSSGSSNVSYTSTSNLQGTDDGQKVWNYLRKTIGLTKEGTAALMGNLFAESGVKSNNLQDSGNKALGLTDDEYTQAVDSGSYANFHDDERGYGLAQWTSSGRKQALQQVAKQNGTSISDLGTQLSYLNSELNGSYAGVLNTLKSATDIKTASNTVLHDFEAPGDQSASVENTRASYGQQQLALYGNNESAGGAGGGFGNASISQRRYKKPTVRKNMRGGSGSSVNYKSTSKLQSANSNNIYRAASMAQKYITTTEGSSVNELLHNAVEILAYIAGDTAEANGKLNALSYLSDLSKQTSSGNPSVNNIYNVSSGKTQLPQSSSVVTPKSSASDIIAAKIARGGY